MTLDRDGMLALVEDSPAQWDDALARALAAEEFRVPGTARAVLVAGMGGSGIAADVARVLSDRDGGAPVVPVKGYDLPAWAGPDTPVIAVSYSGDTAETLSVVAAARDRECPLAVVTSGGTLLSIARDQGVPAVVVPAGRQPRASLAYLSVPVLVGLDRSGLLPGAADALAAVGAHLREIRVTWADGPATVAATLAERIPVFVGGRGVGALVATRAKCQVNENAKAPAFANELPELDHNEVVGWGGGPAVPFGLVEIRAPDDDPRVAARFEATRAVTGEHLPHLGTVDLAGPTPVARLAAGVLWVDLLSVELAFAHGVDPTPIQRINDLKQRLSEP